MRSLLTSVLVFSLLSWTLTAKAQVAHAGDIKIPVATRTARGGSKVIRLTAENTKHFVAMRLPNTCVQRCERADFDARRTFAVQAEWIFRSRGITDDKTLIAILVNAWHECRWNPRDITGQYAGFFQLSSRVGIGRGLSRKSRQHLIVNVLSVARSAEYRQWCEWCAKHPESSAGARSFRFASKVEVCATRFRSPRRRTADHWFAELHKHPRHLPSV